MECGMFRIEVRKSKTLRQPGVDFAFQAGEFVVVAGEPANFEVEAGDDPRKIDHVWITIRAGHFGRLRISVSTWSLKHADDDFDPRMRVGAFSAPWLELPASGMFPAPGLDYGELERAQSIVYRETERPALEKLLRAKTERAICVQAWGALYLRDRLGIHQVHSRRASCSVRSDYIGRDGAVRFYYPEKSAEMVLFKYCGQV
ncbi:MAG: hypothetical protein ABIR29_03305 [Chthoniobacterales bacterium]